MPKRPTFPSSEPSPQDGAITRRSLLGRTAGGVGAFAVMGLTGKAPAFLQGPSPNELVRVGMVGPGKRGRDHLAAMGYPALVNQTRPADVGVIPGIQVVAVCDTFEDNLDQAVKQVAQAGQEPARYVDYREMLENEQLDAVVVATPDHMHARIAMDAARAGCDVYVEKCMANTLEEGIELGRVLNKTKRIAQVGFQLRESTAYQLARKYMRDGVIGRVHSIREFINRNGPEGAWISPLAANGGPPREKVHWEEFLGFLPEREYDPRRYFEWRRYWDYSTGISGDLFSHSLDAATYLLDLGIPRTSVASGGIYYWKDGRETPDHYSVVMEYDEDVELTYSATLSNSYHGHHTVIMGTEGTMEVSWFLKIFPDRFSRKYKDKLMAGEMSSREPFIELTDPAAGLIVKAAPSKLWLEGKGMLLTTRDGQIQDTTRLHFENFFDCMRTREEPSCGYSQGLISTIGCHMSTASYLEGRRVTWEAEKQEIG